MIIGIVGDLGCSKTLTMTHLGNIMEESGICIYSNYHLTFKHNRIEGIDGINEIETDRNALLLDEIWLTADSRKSMAYENMMLSTSLLQSRKKHIDVLYTTQYINQVDVRIRSITNLIFNPQIIVSDDKGIPIYVTVNVLKRNIYGDMLQQSSFDILVYGTHLKYNTDELITKSESNKYKSFLKKYSNFTGKKSELISKLVIDDSMTKSDAELIANYMGI